MWNAKKMADYKLKTSDKDTIIKTIDMHTAGEPLRVVYEGIEIDADSVLDFRRIMKERYDHIRKVVMWEPKGHADMYGAILTKPYREDADFSVIFMHNEGYSTMCGHGILALIRLAILCKLVEIRQPTTKIKIETPAGIVEAFAEIDKNTIKRTYFYNVPSFAYIINESINVEGVGRVKFDIGFGGAFYAYVNANDLGLSLEKDNVSRLIDIGMRIKRAVSDNFEIRHPFEDDLSFLYGTIFTDGQTGKDKISRNVCIFANGEVDRSPTGTGVSGRVALHFAKNEIAKSDVIEIESIIGTRFKGGVVKKTTFGDYDAVVPFIEGNSCIIGKSEFVVKDEDELKSGFFIR